MKHHYKLQESKIVRSFSLMLYLTAIVSVLISGIAFPINMVVFLLISLYAYISFRSYLKNDKNFIEEMNLLLNGNWQLTTSDKKQESSIDWTPDYIQPWLIVLRLKMENTKIKRLFLFQDSLTQKEHRELRILFKYGIRTNPDE